jgi:transcriptional regulator with XRE-family HTH domain
MAWLEEPGRILRTARQRAGLSQRELARRAGTAQSLVARIEGGRTSPRSDTLARLLEAAGYDGRLELLPSVPSQTHMLDDVPRILRMTPEERLREVGNVARFVAEARRV